MINLDLNSIYGPIISDEESDIIYQKLKTHIDNGESVTLNFIDIIAMSTKSAKKIFGKLYFKMKSKEFYDRIIIINASNTLQEIIYDAIVNFFTNNTEDIKE